MAISKSRKDYMYAYQKKKLHRVPLDLSNRDYEELKKVSTECGESVNGYIKKAIRYRIMNKLEKLSN